MNLSKISDDFSAMVQKCKQGATKASDSIEAMATRCKKNIATAVKSGCDCFL